MTTPRTNTNTLYQYGLKILLLLFLLAGSSIYLHAQCPPNQDFEQGTFNNWQCWSQNFYTGGVPAPTLTAPTPGRHDMLSNPPGNGIDPYGLFPKNCPNGSGHSIRIGYYDPGTSGQRVDMVSYKFTIPAGQNTFNLIYHYALVLNQGDVNSHTVLTQPKFIVKAKNITDATDLPCPFNDIVVTSILPGFQLSETPHGGPVYYKDWAAASIRMDNLAGKTIEISFTVTGCGLNGGSHFGYAYLDLNSECSSSFVGATYCPDDAFINVTAPFGYQAYTWWDAGFANIIGYTQTINFTPPPAAGTQISVVVDPYNGYGCRDTLYAQLLDTLTIQSQAGPDQTSCNNSPVQLGVNPKAGYIYSWSPVTGLSNPAMSNPIATPSVSTQYIVTTAHEGGGCISKDTVIVSASVLNNSLEVTGPTSGCIDGSQPTVLKVLPADSVQWYRNGIAIPGATQTQYTVVQNGGYHATVFSFVGCNMTTAVQTISLFPAAVAGFNVNMADQCFKDHQYSFTNSSFVSSGSLSHAWDFGDGTTASSLDVNHTYAQPGTYTVKLVITSNNGCKDSIFSTVNVFASAVAAFTINSPDQCSNGNRFVFTNSSSVSSGNLEYNWNLGDGNYSTMKDVTHSYTLPGTYTVKLLVTTDKGCKDSISFNVNVNPEPFAAFSVSNPQQCFTNNQFVFVNGSSVASGNLTYTWNLGDGTSVNIPDVTHSYAQPGDYMVKLIATTGEGCVDDSSFTVKVYPYAAANFNVQPVCVNLDLPLTNTTINNTATTLNYLWDFGNGQTSTLRDPVYSYTLPGTYTVSLSVNTSQCPLPLTVKTQDVVIDAPVPGVVLPVKDAVMNFPEQLQARPLGTSVLWNPGTSLDTRTSYTPVFRGMNPQLYTIELKTLSGCITVDTQLVKTHKKIEIYVPSAFTPGSSNGLNDHLRPLLMGFDKVNYFRVFNRWGKLIYQMQSDRPGWNGKVNNVLQDMQTVVWMIEAVDVDGKVHRRQGTSMLLK
ncbi:MAG TPA: PKD domain-containing protein [Ferruginibacter sp.]|nr:PKD domain-containing protein [Ferruginibacter sp.]